MIDVTFHDHGTLIPLVLDASIEEQHSASSVVTTHEVERGVAVTDHVRPEARTLRVSVVASDTPIRPTAALNGSRQVVDLALPARQATARGARRRKDGSFDGAELTDTEPMTFAEVFVPDETPTRVLDTWTTLLDARARSLLATVTTRLEVYEDMVLTSIETTQTAEDGTWLKADLIFQQLRLVSTEYVAAPRVPARPRDHETTDLGAVAPEAVEPTRRETTLFRAAQAVANGDYREAFSIVSGGLF